MPFYITGQRESFDGGLVEDDLDEPTMGEKLEKLNLLNSEEKMLCEKEGPSPLAQLPSADSVNVLLRQALHADDRALLLDCLYTQDEKVFLFCNSPIYEYHQLFVGISDLCIDVPLSRL